MACQPGSGAGMVAGRLWPFVIGARSPRSASRSRLRSVERLGTGPRWPMTASSGSNGDQSRRYALESKVKLGVVPVMVHDSRKNGPETGTRITVLLVAVIAVY